jgi:hypothetical protein
LVKVVRKRKGAEGTARQTVPQIQEEWSVFVKDPVDIVDDPKEFD